MTKRLFMRIVLAVMMYAFINPLMSAQTEPSNLSEFYKYESATGGYRVALTDAFKAQVNKASGGELTRGDYTLKTGMQMPNTEPKGQYDGVTVVSLAGTVEDDVTIKSLAWSQWEQRDVTNLRTR